MKKFLRKDESGAVGLIFGLTIALLIAFVGVAIDMGRGYIAKSLAISSLDSATLAAASSAAGATPAQMQTIAEQYFEANFPQNTLSATYTPVNISYNAQTSQVSGSVALHMPTVFGSFIGTHTLNVASATTVSRSASSMEIVLALDVTPSMCASPIDADGPGACKSTSLCTASDPSTKYGALYSAVNLLFNTLDGAIGGGANGNSADVAYAGVFFKSGFFYPNWNGYMIGYDTFATLPISTGWSNQHDQITTALQNFQPNKPHCMGETNVYNGLKGAMSALDPRTGWSNSIAPHPLPFSDTQNLKVMVLLTDGANWSYDDADTVLPATQATYDAGYSDRYAAGYESQEPYECTAIKEEGVVLMTVAFALPNIPASDTAKTILQNCATPGFYFEVDTLADLQAAFKKIADALVTIRITQ